MKFTYKDLVALTERYNTLLQANNFDVLCYVSGEAMFMKEAILDETSKTKGLYQYLQGDSFILDVVKAAKKYNVSASKIIEKFIAEAFEKINMEKEAREANPWFSKIQFAPAKQRQQRAILLLNRINELFYQWDYGLYAYMDGQKLAELEVCHAPSYELVVRMLEWLVEQTVKENQIPLVYARVHCCKTRWQELGLPCCIEIREYQNTFLKKNMKFLTVSLTNFILRQGAKCYFEFSEYQVETLEYDAAKLYHWLMVTGKKLREVPKGKMTFWFSYQMYLDESKDKLLSVLRLEPNVLGSAKYYIEKNEADYKFILGVLKEMKQMATASREVSSEGTMEPKEEAASVDLQTEAPKMHSSTEVQAVSKVEPSTSEKKAHPTKLQSVEVPEETQASEQEDKYGDVLRSIQTKLDDVLNAVIENSVITMDGLEMVNTNVEAVNAGVQGVAESLEESRAMLLSKFDELQNGLEQCMEKKDTEGLCALLEKKITLIKELHEKDAPDVAAGEDIYFLLAFLHTEKAEELITELFSYLQTGAYKTQYEEKISKENTILYSAECNLGKVMVYRKDGVTYLKNLQIKQQYLQENLVAFLEKYSVKTGSQVFFDNQIYEELDRLMKGTKQSFHMVMPWVKDWRLNTYEARFG